MLSLVIALPLGARITGQQVGRREIVGALAVVVGISLFLSVGSPKGGTTHPSASAWWAAGLTSLLLVGIAAAEGRRRRGATRALFFGSGAGIAFGLQAAVTKVFVGELGNGVLALLGNWSIYVLIVSALVGFMLMQSALKTGVLAPSIASSNALTLFASVILGITVFGESLGRGGGHLIPAVIGLVVALAGISRLAAAPEPTSGPKLQPA
jgi:drug/metabolite transporter (DMT)-like permease